MEIINEHFKRQTTVAGKSVIITGGTTGIGRATAFLLASLGAQVLITGTSHEHLDDTLTEAATGGLSDKLYGVITDLSTQGGVEDLFAEADKQLKSVDILINNAALAFQGVSDGKYEDWQRVVNTNVLGYIACSRQALDRMLPGGQGHIVNIGSMSADVREKDSSVYVATKSAIQGFSESLRKEINEKGIKVTLIEPGAVATDMQPVEESEQRKQEARGEMLYALDIANAIVYALTQPKGCDVVELKIRPHLQII